MSVFEPALSSVSNKQSVDAESWVAWKTWPRSEKQI